MSGQARAVLLIGAAGLLAWLLWPRRGAGSQGAPAGSLATDPHTQSLLMQDINARRDGAGGFTGAAVHDQGNYAGNAPGVLTIEITKDCSHYGTCP